MSITDATPLQEQFGAVHFPVTCQAVVQKKFDLALAMLHTFSFPEAAKTFMAVAGEDPDCAMAYWGVVATAIGSLYGGRPGPMALQGSAAVERAKAVGGKTPRERDYIATVDLFYRGADTNAADREHLQRRIRYCPRILSRRMLFWVDLLMEMNEPAQALQAFEAALKREPSRFGPCSGQGGGRSRGKFGTGEGLLHAARDADGEC